MTRYEWLENQNKNEDVTFIIAKAVKDDYSPNAKSYVSKDIMKQIIESHETNDEINALVSILYFGFLRI